MSFLPAAGSLIGGILGVGQGIFGSQANKQASGQMSQGNLMAALLQQQIYQQQQQNLAPFRQAGQNALGALSPLIGIQEGGNPLTAPLTSKFAPTIEQLMQTPGYQFTLDQNLRALQNAYAAKGLGSSSNALLGALDYASGLASQTYQQQFQNYWGENQNIYNMLAGIGNTGLQAAGAGANSAGQFTTGIGNALQGHGAAQAQGTMGANNALFGGLNSAYGLLNASPSLGGNTNSWWNKPPSMDFFGFSS